mmetsp:Transcript_16249/g.22800  ORF Transcript_16249/g.22800 Transcript_16249/m.22800 type:complete len:247 (+) Transcript_16249:81-821(+)
MPCNSKCCHDHDDDNGYNVISPLLSSLEALPKISSRFDFSLRSFSFSSYNSTEEDGNGKRLASAAAVAAAVASTLTHSLWGLRGIVEDAKRGIRMPLVYFAAEIAVKRPRPNFEHITEMLRLLLWKDEGLLRTLQHSSGDDAKLPISIGAQCELIRALDFLHQREFQAKNIAWIVAKCINCPKVISGLTAEYVLGSNGNSLARLNQAKIKLADQVSTVIEPTPTDISLAGDTQEFSDQDYPDDGSY